MLSFEFGPAAATVTYAPTELDDEARAAIAVRLLDDSAAMLRRARLTLGLAADYGETCAELDDLHADVEHRRTALERLSKRRRRRCAS